MSDVEETLGVKLNSETNVAIGIVSGVHTGPHPIGLGVIRKYETLQLNKQQQNRQSERVQITF